jgi:hypothetical protein
LTFQLMKLTLPHARARARTQQVEVDAGGKRKVEEVEVLTVKEVQVRLLACLPGRRGCLRGCLGGRLIH